MNLISRDTPVSGILKEYLQAAIKVFRDGKYRPPRCDAGVVESKSQHCRGGTASIFKRGNPLHVKMRLSGSFPPKEIGAHRRVLVGA